MKNTLTKYFPGILLTAIIALPAWVIGTRFPMIGSPILGILFGIILTFWKRPIIFTAGLSYTSKKILQYSIILLGFQMNLFQILQVGKQTLVLMVFTLTATFLTAYLVGKLLKINPNTNILIGIGTSICGGSAIAAAAPVIDAKDDEVVHAISTIFLFNVIAAFLFPALGHIFNMSNYTFGLWAGTAINDTSSVVAAGYSYSFAAGNLAVIVKLTRTLMIVPVTITLALYQSKKTHKNGTYHISKVFPWFVLGFIFAALLNTFLPLISEFSVALAQIGKYMIVMAMTSIGLNTNLHKLLKNGKAPILLGLICWAVLSCVSIIIQHILF